MCFYWKNQNFGSFFLINQKKLRLGEKTKNVLRANYSLHDESNNLDFPWPLFELFGLKTCQKPSKMKSKKTADLVKTVTFSFI